jgi:site-specific recombinase XerD
MNSLILPTSPTFDYSALDRADLQPSTKDKYRRALDRMMLAGVNPMDYDSLQAHADSLSPSARAFLKAALKVCVAQEMTRIKSQATPGNMLAIQALIARIEAMDETIQIHTPKGAKTHTWLTAAQVEAITALPDRSAPRGLRDYIVLSLLLGAGLRREELSTLTYDALKQQPTRAGMRDVLSVLGKGNKRRTIPISAKLARHLREWHALTGNGYVCRAINKAGKINGSLSPIGIHNIVRRYGAQIGIAALDSHDLRRSYAMLGLNAGVPITQISVLLGHAKVSTTQRYLNLELDLEKTISDYIPLSGD